MNYRFSDRMVLCFSFQSHFVFHSNETATTTASSWQSGFIALVMSFMISLGCLSLYHKPLSLHDTDPQKRENRDTFDGTIITEKQIEFTVDFNGNSYPITIERCVLIFLLHVSLTTAWMCVAVTSSFRLSSLFLETRSEGLVAIQTNPLFPYCSSMFCLFLLQADPEKLVIEFHNAIMNAPTHINNMTRLQLGETVHAMALIHSHYYIQLQILSVLSGQAGDRAQ